jgi:hypothetical protein
MASSDDNHASTAIPEADRLEQERQANPDVGSEPEWPTSTTQEVNEADRLEQSLPVLSDPDEDYTPDPL